MGSPLIIMTDSTMYQTMDQHVGLERAVYT